TRQRRALIRALAAGALSGAIATVLLLPAGSSARAQSAPRNMNQPTVYGTAVQGKTLFTTNGSWTGTAPISFRYRWLRCDATGGGANGVNCSAISGATGKTYTVKTVDIGTTIRVRVTGKNSAGSASVVSAPTAVVTKAEAPSGSAISINDVALPNRLIIQRVLYRPNTL